MNEKTKNIFDLVPKLDVTATIDELKKTDHEYINKKSAMDTYKEPLYITPELLEMIAQFNHYDNIKNQEKESELENDNLGV